jgi:hypothetical protein
MALIDFYTNIRTATIETIEALAIERQSYGY